MAVGWIKLDKGVYEKGIEAILRERDRLGLSSGALVEYQQAPEPIKRDMERIWKMGFSALMRRLDQVKLPTWDHIPDAVYDAALVAAFQEQVRLWGPESVPVVLDDDQKRKYRQMWRIGYEHLKRAWLS